MYQQTIRRGDALPMLEEPGLVPGDGPQPVGRVVKRDGGRVGTRLGTRNHRFLRVQSARRALADFTPGTDFEVMTNGAFSVLDALLVLLDRAGRPCHLVVSTWSVGLYDVEVVTHLRDTGRLSSVRFILDVSVRSNIGTRTFAPQLLELFKAGNIRTTRTHAKYFLLFDDTGAVSYSLTSTANLNENKRLELMYFSDDPERLDFYRRATDAVFEEVAEGFTGSHGAPSLPRLDPGPQREPLRMGRVGSVGFVDVGNGGR